MRRPGRSHAHPVSLAARRRAAGLGWTEGSGWIDPPKARSRTAAPRTWKPIDLVPRRSRPGRWIALVPMAVVVLALVASTQLGAGAPGFAGTAAGGPSARPSAAPTAAVIPVAPASPDPAVASAAALPSGLPSGYQWPLDHGRITSWFGPLPAQPYVVDGKSFHDGIDIASFCGDPVAAAHDGVVLVAGRHVDKWFGWVGGYDAHVARLDAKDLWGSLPIVVIVDDGNGYRSIYMHLGLAAVKAGDHVRAGQLIGYEGRTGNATGCHLHYALFDPSDTAVFETAPAYVKRYALPPAEVARIDPLLVFPPIATVSVTWGWGARD